MNERAENLETVKSTSADRRSVLIAGAGLAAALAACIPSVSRAQEAGKAKSGAGDTKAEQDVLRLSKDKWGWMSERKVESLEGLFHEKAVFVHMGGTMSRAQELDVIRSGAIQYKKADIQESSVRIIGTTAIILNRLRLLAVVGGNEVTNPFVVPRCTCGTATRGSWRRSRSRGRSASSKAHRNERRIRPQQQQG